MEAKINKRGKLVGGALNGMPRANKPPTKYTIVLNERQDDRLAQLARDLGMSKADIVRKAVGLLDVVVKESSAPGKSLEVVDQNGSRTRLVVDLM